MGINLNSIMKEAEKMQLRMKKAQEELSELTVQGTFNGVDVTMNGRHQILKVKINSNLMNENVETLENFIIAAFNKAFDQVEKASKEKINTLTAGLNLPTDLIKSEKKEEDK